MYFEQTPSPRLVATATGSMQLVPDDAQELAERCHLLEVRLDALGDGFGPLGIGEVAAMALRIQSILGPLTVPGRRAIPLLATAATAPEAAGRCRSRTESLGLLRAAVQAGFPWIDFDLGLAGSLGTGPGADHVQRARDAFCEARLAELRTVLASEPRTELVVSEHWTAEGAGDGLTPRLEVLRLFLERALRVGIWPRTVKLVEAPGPGGSARALAFLARIPEVRAALAAWTEELGASRPGLRVPLLAMFAGGPDGAATRTVCTAAGSDWVYAAARADEERPVPGQLTVEALCATWPGGRPPAHGTPIFGVLGERVAGSASPALFTSLFEELGVRGVYGRFDVADAGAVLEHARSGALPIAGLSVTAPHKQAAWNFGGGDRAPLAEGARGLRAYNTLVKGADGAWTGANTDLLGARAAAEELVGEDWFARPRSVVVLGAGGAARAALRALSDPRATAAWEPWLAAWRSGAAELPGWAGPGAAGGGQQGRHREDERGGDGPSAAGPAGAPGDAPAMRLTVLGRDPRRAMALARECGASFGGLEELAELAPDLVVHATPAGSPAAADPHAWLPGAAALVGLAARAPKCAVLDANYKPDPTPLVAAARAAGLRAATGARWFWAQAAAQLERFRRAATASAPGAASGAASGAPDDEQAPSPVMALPSALPSGLQRELAGESDRRRSAAEILVLVGARGSGKTTLGRALAGRAGLAFRDLDDELAAAAGAGSAGELLAARGEADFRAAESAHFVAALEGARGPGVWATGGGLLSSPVARVALAAARASGRVRCAWLTATAATLAERVASDPTVRPALFARLDLGADDRGDQAGDQVSDQAAEQKAEAQRVLAERSPAYAAAADLELDTEGLDRDALVAALAAGFGRALEAGDGEPAPDGAGA